MVLLSGMVLIVQTLLLGLVFWANYSSDILGAEAAGSLLANDTMPVGNSTLSIDDVYFGRLVTPSWCVKRPTDGLTVSGACCTWDSGCGKRQPVVRVHV
jgi:hypothetical protein